MFKIVKILNKMTSCSLILLCLNAAALSGAMVKRADDFETVSVTNEIFKAHCSGRRCVNMYYGSPKEVAIFDSEPEIRINDDSTYDVNPSLKTRILIFENSTFANFPLNLFNQFPLSELDLRNCSVQRMSIESFRLAPSLNILLLSDNKLTRIEENTFLNAPNLQFLFLENNLIDTLERNCFNDLHRLRYLNLQNNLLTELPSNIFTHLDSLNELNLSNNRLRTLDPDLFNENRNLHTILLNGNELIDIEFYLFKPIAQLDLLDLSFNPFLERLMLSLRTRVLLATNCNLKRVNVYGEVVIVDFSHNRIMELYFAEPAVLEELTVRDNDLEQLSMLSGAVNLRNLDVSDNVELGNDWFEESFKIESLERLDLSNTSLTALPVMLVAANPKLQRLNIAQNQISEINPSTFVYLGNLQHFKIHANNWNCYNLNNVMDMLIRPKGIAYTNDEVDADFPGEYIGGIACMYRLETSDENNAMNDYNTDDNISFNVETSSTEPLIQAGPSNEVLLLRNELKAIVQFYEQKFDRVFQMLEKLDERLKMFEKLNETLFQHITITV